MIYKSEIYKLIKLHFLSFFEFLSIVNILKVSFVRLLFGVLHLFLIHVPMLINYIKIRN
jgi:hypothetical protein